MNYTEIWDARDAIVKAKKPTERMKGRKIKMKGRGTGVSRGKGGITDAEITQAEIAAMQKAVAENPGTSMARALQAKIPEYQANLRHQQAVAAGKGASAGGWHPGDPDPTADLLAEFGVPSVGS